MSELIPTSSDNESGFEEPEPPLSKIATVLNQTWDEYLACPGDKTDIIQTLHTYTTYLLMEFSESGTDEEDLPEHVQTALMCARQPILPMRASRELNVDSAHTRSARRMRRMSHLGTDVMHRFAWLRNSH